MGDISKLTAMTKEQYDQLMKRTYILTEAERERLQALNRQAFKKGIEHDEWVC